MTVEVLLIFGEAKEKHRKSSLLREKGLNQPERNNSIVV